MSFSVGVIFENLLVKGGYLYLKPSERGGKNLIRWWFDLEPLTLELGRSLVKPGDIGPGAFNFLAFALGFGNLKPLSRPFANLEKGRVWLN